MGNMWLRWRDICLHRFLLMFAESDIIKVTRIAYERKEQVDFIFFLLYKEQKTFIFYSKLYTRLLHKLTIQICVSLWVYRYITNNRHKKQGLQQNTKKTLNRIEYCFFIMKWILFFPFCFSLTKKLPLYFCTCPLLTSWQTWGKSRQAKDNNITLLQH